MHKFYDSNKEIVRLGRELGRGGEGAVYEIVENIELVAKIYHEPISLDKAEKLRQMAALKDDKLLRLTAWVTDVLHSKSNDSVVGFVMPRIDSGKAIHELYNPKSRRELFPKADWRFLISGATNLARSFAVIHSHGHAIGDVNHGNVVIAKDSTVRLIDCDSYQLNAPNQSFLCEVGVSTHTPPELQGKSLRGVTRTANHDAFGLAVLIFQLLFMGRHPFSGNFLGEEDNSLESSILEHRFAYGDGAAARQMQQPPGTLPLSAVTPQVANLFERAFLAVENRPAAREWVDALKDLSQNLQRCEANELHYYLQTQDKCSWCKLEKQFGVDFFEEQALIKYQAERCKPQLTCESCRKIIQHGGATNNGIKLCKECYIDFVSSVKSTPQSAKKQPRNKSRVKSISKSISAIQQTKSNLFSTQMIWQTSNFVVTPETVKLQKTPENLTLVCGWVLGLSKKENLIALFGIIVLMAIYLSLIFYGYQMIASNKPDLLSDLLLILFFLGLFFSIYISITCTNKTIIEVTKTELNIKHTPLSFMKNLKLPLAEIIKIQREIRQHEYKGKVWHSHRLYVLTTNNKKMKILPYYLSSENEISYVTQIIEGWLHSVRKLKTASTSKQLNILP